MHACRAPQPIVQTVETVRTEREIVRDTVVQIAPDSAMVKAWLECDSLNNVIVKQLEIAQGERVKPIVKRYTTTGGMVLRMDCKEDSLKYEIEVRDRIIEEMKTETKIVKVRERNGYDRFTSGGFWILLVVVVLRVAWWFVKKYYLRC